MLCNESFVSCYLLLINRKKEDERKERLEKIAASFMPPTNLYSDQPRETESTKRLALYDSSSDSDEDEKEKYRKKKGDYGIGSMVLGL